MIGDDAIVSLRKRGFIGTGVAEPLDKEVAYQALRLATEVLEYNDDLDHHRVTAAMMELADVFINLCGLCEVWGVRTSLLFDGGAVPLPFTERRVGKNLIGELMDVLRCVYRGSTHEESLESVDTLVYAIINEAKELDIELDDFYYIVNRKIKADENRGFRHAN